MKRLTTSEKVFKILAYTILLIFSIACIYPLWFTLVNALSGKQVVDNNEVLLYPIGFNWMAFEQVYNNKAYWLAYSNTIFYTIYYFLKFSYKLFF